jgi:penicillin-binding protein 1A
MPHRGPPWKKIAIRAAQVLGILACLSIVAVLLVVRHYEKDLPSVEQLKAGYDPPQVTRVLARDGTLLANLFTERRTVVPFSQIPDQVKQAFLAAEDASFYEHEGLDYLGMLRAMAANLRAGKTTQCGSTITQQVIKNVLLDSERSLRRKIREVLLVHRLEQSLTKDEIFWLYLNHIYLGHGRYGIEEASRFYFGKPPSGLTLPHSGRSISPARCSSYSSTSPGRSGCSGDCLHEQGASDGFRRRHRRRRRCRHEGFAATRPVRP